MTYFNHDSTWKNFLSLVLELVIVRIESFMRDCWGLSGWFWVNSRPTLLRRLKMPHASLRTNALGFGEMDAFFTSWEFYRKMTLLFRHVDLNCRRPVLEHSLWQKQRGASTFKRTLFICWEALKYPVFVWLESLRCCSRVYCEHMLYMVVIKCFGPCAILLAASEKRSTWHTRSKISSPWLNISGAKTCLQMLMHVASGIKHTSFWFQTLTGYIILHRGWKISSSNIKHPLLSREFWRTYSVQVVQCSFLEFSSLFTCTRNCRFWNFQTAMPGSNVGTVMM